MAATVVLGLLIAVAIIIYLYGLRIVIRDRRSVENAEKELQTSELHQRLRRVEADFRSPDKRAALDAVVELRRLAAGVTAKPYGQEDRDAVWALMSSMIEPAVKKYALSGQVERHTRNELEQEP